MDNKCNHIKFNLSNFCNTAKIGHSLSPFVRRRPYLMAIKFPGNWNGKGSFANIFDKSGIAKRLNLKNERQNLLKFWYHNKKNRSLIIKSQVTEYRDPDKLQDYNNSEREIITPLHKIIRQRKVISRSLNVSEIKFPNLHKVSLSNQYKKPQARNTSTKNYSMMINKLIENKYKIECYNFTGERASFKEKCEIGRAHV